VKSEAGESIDAGIFSRVRGVAMAVL
jgi:hypothetical protein